MPKASKLPLSGRWRWRFRDHSVADARSLSSRGPRCEQPERERADVLSVSLKGGGGRRVAAKGSSNQKQNPLWWLWFFVLVLIIIATSTVDFAISNVASDSSVSADYVY